MAPRSNVALGELIQEQLSIVIKPLEHEIARLYEMAIQNDRALRGNNGTVGVVARVEKLESKVEDLKKSVDSLLTILETKTEKKSDSLSKTELFDKLVVPIAIAGFSVFLFTYMPKIIALLGG